MKSFVTDFYSLNIQDLAHGGWLQPWSAFEWAWRKPHSAERTWISVTVLPDALQLTVSIHSQPVQQQVQLIYSMLHRGGRRPWFRCPVCRRRVGVLYHAANLPFRCRRCSGLAYPSQYPRRGTSYGRRHRCLSQTRPITLQAKSALPSHHGKEPRYAYR